ncbi:MAG: hypothetical protein U0167_13085 [bacterium]
MKRMALVLVALLLLTPRAAGAASPYYEGWDSGSLGIWQPNTLQDSVAVVPSGGHPNGFLRCWGTASANWPIGMMTYDPACTGDFASIDQISFDLRFIAGTQFGETMFRVRYLDGYHNGWHYTLSTTFPIGIWVPFTIPLDPDWTDAQATAAGWVQETVSAHFAETMAHVFTTEIRINGVGYLEAGVDEFRLRANPAVGVGSQDFVSWGRMRSAYR